MSYLILQVCLLLTILLNQARNWFVEIAFVREVGVCVCLCMCMCPPPKAINFIHVILTLYNQLNKFVVFRNVTMLSMYGRGLCSKAHRDRNQSNKAMLVP